MHYERIRSLHQAFSMNVLSVKVGQMIEVHEDVTEGDNKRIWKFSGLVLRVKNPKNATGTFTMRGETSGVVIEKTYPLSFQRFVKIVLLNEFKVKQSRIYFMRDKVGKAARLKSTLNQHDRGQEIYKK